MDYTKFGEVIEQKSPIELHKTDYNNYQDLSHFIEQYNIAQQLIQESKNFYRSFLVSKLIKWSDLVTYKYIDNIDCFVEHKLTKLKPGAISRYDTYTEIKYSDFLVNAYLGYLSKGFFNSHNSYDSKKVKLYEYDKIPEYKKKRREIEDLYDKNSKELIALIRNNMSYEDAKKFTYSLREEDWEESNANGYTFRWIAERINELHSSKPTGKVTIHVDRIKNDYDECVEKYKDTFDKIVELYNIGNELYEKSEKIRKNIEYSYDCNKSERYKTIMDLIVSLNITEKFNNGIGYFIRLEDKDKEKEIMSIIHHAIIDDINKYNCILDIKGYIGNYYIIDNDRKIKYFTKSLHNVDIELSNDQKKLICRSQEVESHQKYSWPSDAPTIRTTTTYTISFDTSNNEICDYNVKDYTEEISNKHRY